MLSGLLITLGIILMRRGGTKVAPAQEAPPITEEVTSEADYYDG